MGTRTALKSIVEDMRSLTYKYFESVNQQKGKDADDIMDEILKKDAVLQAKVDQLEVHQSQQRKITQLEAEIESYDQTIRQVVDKLRQTEANLGEICSEAREMVTAMDNAQAHPVEVSTLLSYARRITGQASALPSMLESGRPPMPPFPEDHHMRAGCLYNNVPELGQSDSDEDHDTKAADKPMPSLLIPPDDPPPTAATGSGAALAAGIIPTPPGWKPGDRIVLPPVPEGWKKGDPIELHSPTTHFAGLMSPKDEKDTFVPMQTSLALDDSDSDEE